MKETFIKELNVRKTHVKKLLTNLVQCEDNYLFTNDIAFLRSDSQQKKGSNTHTNLLTNELRQKIDSYFYIIVRNLRDIVPKIIG